MKYVILFGMKNLGFFQRKRGLSGRLCQFYKSTVTGKKMVRSKIVCTCYFDLSTTVLKFWTNWIGRFSDCVTGI